MKFILFAAFASAFFWATSSSLTEMTKADCQAGISTACEELKR